MTNARTHTHTVTHPDGDFAITVREQLGRDIGNGYFVRLTIRDAIRAQLGLGENASIPDVLWENISTVSKAITQTVETSGAIPFEVPPCSAPLDEIVAFYECLLDLPGRYLKAFADALKKIEEPPVPLETGSKDDEPSTSELKPA